MLLEDIVEEPVATKADLDGHPPGPEHKEIKEHDPYANLK